MQIIIYGTPTCSYCDRAKTLANQLQDQLADCSYTYIDLISENISKEELATIIGRPTRTVPQIIIDQQYIGGYTEFQQWVKQNNLLA